jgi:hypothetical protein
MTNFHNEIFHAILVPFSKSGTNNRVNSNKIIKLKKKKTGKGG